MISKFRIRTADIMIRIALHLLWSCCRSLHPKRTNQLSITPVLAHHTYEDQQSTSGAHSFDSLVTEVSQVLWSNMRNLHSNRNNLILSCFSLLRVHLIFLEVPGLYLCLDQWITGLTTSQHQNSSCHVAIHNMHQLSSEDLSENTLHYKSNTQGQMSI